ncbi:MAG: type 1 glutamine amidotransferase domain-containing protein [Rhodomicrobium sp.]
MSILIVVTSHDRLGDTGKPTGLWLEEFATPYYIFRDEGVKVVLASPKGGRPLIDPRSEDPQAQTDSTRRFFKDKEAHEAFENTARLSTINPSDYGAVFYPGGHGPLWDLSEDPHSIQIIETLFAAGKPVGAVCHGPAVFRQTKGPDGASLIQGKSVTGFSNSEEAAVGLTEAVPFLVEDMLKENGGNYSNGDNWQPYVRIDGNLVTGQNPKSSEGVAWLFLDKLLNRETAREPGSTAA